MTDLTHTIEERYGVRVAEQPSLLSGGFENEVQLINTSHGRFAVRVCATWIDPERVASEDEVLSFMADRIPEITAAVPASDGSTWFVYDDRVVTLFPFFHGHALHREDDKLRLRAAGLLAQIHRTGLEYNGSVALPPLAELDWDRNPYWNLAKVGLVLDELATSPLVTAQTFAAAADRIFAEIEWGRVRAATLRGGLTYGIVQGDYWPGNVLAHAGHITAVLDWLETRRDALVVELGRATWEFCSDPDDHTLLRDRADAFLAAYRDAGGPVADDELNVLVDAMRLHVLADMLRDLTFTDPEEAAGYHLGSLKRLEHLAGAEPLPR
jgi:Ser/Thr protein kinase RdoA (MazF antagonist)